MRAAQEVDHERVWQDSRLASVRPRVPGDGSRAGAGRPETVQARGARCARCADRAPSRPPARADPDGLDLSARDRAGRALCQGEPQPEGRSARRGLKQYSWDDSVKSLVYFPQVLTMLNDKIDWLQKLGDAF